MTEIYRVKVKQVLLQNRYSVNQSRTHGCDYFPFDNVYLIPAKESSIAARMFRYCLIMEVSDHFKKILRGIEIVRYREIGLKRDDNAFAWKSMKKSYEEVERATSFLDKGKWLCIAPTYAITAPEKKTENKGTQLQYVLSHAITRMHNMRVSLPQISLQTPRKTIPALCALCRNIAEYYNNTCTPGREKCRKNINLTGLEEDNSNRDSITESIKNAGAVE